MTEVSLQTRRPESDRARRWPRPPSCSPSVFRQGRWPPSPLALPTVVLGTSGSLPCSVASAPATALPHRMPTGCCAPKSSIDALFARRVADPGGLCSAGDQPRYRENSGDWPRGRPQCDKSAPPWSTKLRPTSNRGTTPGISKGDPSPTSWRRQAALRWHRPKHPPLPRSTRRQSCRGRHQAQRPRRPCLESGW
jgi:hypothetical protein